MRILGEDIVVPIVLILLSVATKPPRKPEETEAAADWSICLLSISFLQFRLLFPPAVKQRACTFA